MAHIYTVDQSAADDLDAGDTAPMFLLALQQIYSNRHSNFNNYCYRINDAPDAIDDTDSGIEDAQLQKLTQKMF